MGILIGAHELTMAFGARPLFSRITFAIETGERIGLIGPNGAGKSTLLRILAGKLVADSGSLSVRRGLKVAFLEQVPEFAADATVLSAILEGSFDAYDWEEMGRAETLLSKLAIPESAGIAGDTPVERLSGGWKKRVALARELMRAPDLLLLDEPTNHLDVEGILWLEDFLEQSPFATITITHDRVFLQKVSTRILELNRRYPDGLFSVRGDYSVFLEAKEALLASQESTENKWRNTLRREVEWLRQGAKARTTKQQARINRTHELGAAVEELGERNVTRRVRLDFQEVERNPKKLIEAEGIAKSYGGRLVVPPLSLTITPKSRIGLLGVNGSGKSTLIRLLLKAEAPDRGSVTHAENIKFVYFDQNREGLDPEATVAQTVCRHGDHVEFRGGSVHVRSYLNRFLFTGNQLDMPVGRLSGGEQSRLLLARLMLREANLLVLDEPTNDLDMATLDLLQEVLQEFNGAVVLVSHDRYFLDQVTNQILAFGTDAKGVAKIEAFAELSQWIATRERERSNRSIERSPARGPKEAGAAKQRLGFKEQRELDGMEAAIGKAEGRINELERESILPEVATDATRLQAIAAEISTLRAQVDQFYARWAELERSSG